MGSIIAACGVAIGAVLIGILKRIEWRLRILELEEMEEKQAIEDAHLGEDFD